MAVFTDATATESYRLYFLEFEIRGESGGPLHAEMVVVRGDSDGFNLAAPDMLHDLAPATGLPDSNLNADANAAIDFLKSGYQLEQRQEVQEERRRHATVIREYLTRSFTARIGAAEKRVMALRAREAGGESEVALARQRAEADLDELQRARRERSSGLDRLTIARNGPVRHVGTVLVIPTGTTELPDDTRQLMSATQQ